MEDQEKYKEDMKTAWDCGYETAREELADLFINMVEEMRPGMDTTCPVDINTICINYAFDCVVRRFKTYKEKNR